MSRVVSSSTNRSHDVLRVTRVWGTSQVTVYRHRRCDNPASGVGQARSGRCPARRRWSRRSASCWPRARSTARATGNLGATALRWHSHLQAPRPTLDPGAWSAGARPGRAAAWPEGPRRHPPNRAGRRDVGHRSDLDLGRRGQASIFVTVDHGSTECVGIHAARRATRFEALEPLRQGMRAGFGAFAEGIASGLKLRHDHGSQFVADDYQLELAFLGIESSPAFVREPGGNGCVERFIRTQGEPALGPPLRHHRGAAPGPGRLSGHLQPDLDRRAPRAIERRPRSAPTSSASPRPPDASPMSHDCGPLQRAAHSAQTLFFCWASRLRRGAESPAVAVRRPVF